MEQTQTTPNPAADEVTLLDDAARGSVVTYLPRFLVEAEADALFAELCAGTPFHTEAPVMFGRAIEVRRRTYSFGEPGTRYRYSGVEEKRYLARDSLPAFSDREGRRHRRPFRSARGPAEAR